MNRTTTYKGIIWTAALLLGLISACSSPYLTPVPEYESSETRHTRGHNDTYRNVFLIYSCGFNNISSYLKQDIEDVASSSLMSHYRDVVLVFSHSTARYGNYSQNTSPVLTRFRKDADGSVIRDTLMVMRDSTISASAETLNEVLTFVHEKFPATGYGMLFTSHGTGWVPAGYASDPSKFDPQAGNPGNIWSRQRRSAATPTPYFELPQDGSHPAVKSFGVHNVTKSTAYEMEITDMAAAYPMKMDYIIFDACFMGGIEVAYEFRNVCDKMVFSQTEILADGMDYDTMTTYLFKNGKPDLKGFCQNFYDYYNSKSGEFQSATISLVDCTMLEPLAQVCSEIFSANRAGIAALEGSDKVQKYFRKEYEDIHKWYYDLESIARNCGSDESQLQRLSDALEGCILYKAATERFISMENAANPFYIKEHSGLSMYLPYSNRPYLNAFYKELEWNKATGLVQ